MPTDSTSSTSSAARDRAATSSEAAAAAPETASTPADQARDVTQSVSPPSGSGTGTGTGTKSKATDPACPTCRGPLERYRGSAAHKAGSFWCYACGVRQRLPVSAAADEATALASTSGTKAAGAG